MPPRRGTGTPPAAASPPARREGRGRRAGRGGSSETLPLDGGGKGGGGLPARTDRGSRATPPQPLPIEGRGHEAQHLHALESRTIRPSCISSTRPQRAANAG